MIGPIEPWGFLVLCGCALGVYLFIRRCALHGLDGMLFSRVGTWILIWSFACARASHVFLYRWEAYRDQPLDMFKIWEGGFSSYGGFFGAAIVAIYYARQHRINFWPLADAGIYAFMWGWTIGRTGCFLIHDHPGRISNFVLATEMRLQAIGDTHPVIHARHDLGLYDGLLSLAISLFYFWGDRKTRFAGFYFCWGVIFYSVPRFFLDFLRATDLSWSDSRYAGLTPAQYGSVLLLGIGVWSLSVCMKNDRP